MNILYFHSQECVQKVNLVVLKVVSTVTDIKCVHPTLGKKLHHTISCVIHFITPINKLNIGKMQRFLTLNLKTSEKSDRWLLPVITPPAKLKGRGEVGQSCYVYVRERFKMSS